MVSALHSNRALYNTSRRGIGEWRYLLQNLICIGREWPVKGTGREDIIERFLLRNELTSEVVERF